MGGYDLYGNYYLSRRDALNAEDAQCAAIDARIAMKKIDEYREIIEDLRMENIHLKERIKELEGMQVVMPEKMLRELGDKISLYFAKKQAYLDDLRRQGGENDLERC